MSAWTDFVKKIAKERGLKYRDAMKVASPLYKAMKAGKKPQKVKKPKKVKKTKKTKKGKFFKINILNKQPLDLFEEEKQRVEASGINVLEKKHRGKKVKKKKYSKINILNPNELKAMVPPPLPKALSRIDRERLLSLNTKPIVKPPSQPPPIPPRKALGFRRDEEEKYEEFKVGSVKAQAGSRHHPKFRLAKESLNNTKVFKEGLNDRDLILLNKNNPQLDNLQRDAELMIDGTHRTIHDDKRKSVRHQRGKFLDKIEGETRKARVKASVKRTRPRAIQSALKASQGILMKQKRALVSEKALTHLRGLKVKRMKKHKEDVRETKKYLKSISKEPKKDTGRLVFVPRVKRKKTKKDKKSKRKGKGPNYEL